MGQVAAQITFAVILVAAGVAHADSFTGKVVGVADGDTLTVLRDKTPVKIRLHSVDSPEKAQPFGQKAKQLTSGLVFGKVVKVEVVTKDKYGRTVARVYVTRVESVDPYDDQPYGPVRITRCLNEELLQAGLAWWYKKYAPKDQKLAKLEAEAKQAKRGLWADPNPTPPWDWRKAKRTPKDPCSSDDDCILRLCCCTWRALKKGAPAPPTCARRCRCKFPPKPQGVRCEDGRCKVIHQGQAAVPSNIEAVRVPGGGKGFQVKGVITKLSKGAVKLAGRQVLHGNARSKVLHWTGCHDYSCKHCTASFTKVGEALKAGYKPHEACAKAPPPARLPEGAYPKLAPQYRTAPARPWSRVRLCQSDADCTLMPIKEPCSCAPCTPVWRPAVNKAALRAWRAKWAARSCIRRQVCPACVPLELGAKAACVEGQCMVRP